MKEQSQTTTAALNGAEFAQTILELVTEIENRISRSHDKSRPASERCAALYANARPVKAKR